jgi:light-regulated signal transduction histidine kinase (bacteriophytochrome)
LVNENAKGFSPGFENEKVIVMETLTRSLIEKFIYSCSHDLRGPVASIKGLVKLAGEHPADIDTGHCLKMIGECNNKLDQLITSLQEYMINEQHVVQMEAVNANEVLEETIHHFSDHLADNSVIVESTGFKTECITDRYVFSRLLFHLVSNAITFSDPAKRVKKVNINLADNEKKLVLNVSDNGIGIPRNAQSRVFEIFNRRTKVLLVPGSGCSLLKGLLKRYTPSYNYIPSKAEAPRLV